MFRLGDMCKLYLTPACGVALHSGVPPTQHQQRSCDSDRQTTSAEGFWEPLHVCQLPVLGYL
jgi:hypothetical protein